MGNLQAGALSREVFPTQPGQLTKKPVVILTNSSTASASEVLAGALHGNNRYVQEHNDCSCVVFSDTGVTAVCL